MCLFFLTNFILLQEIRSISEDYEVRGLSNFPDGIPFTFWEQYIKLKWNIGIATVAIIAVVFVAISILLMNIWTATICVLVLSMLVVEMAGFMSLVNLKLNPISGVSLITSVGIGVVFVCHLSLVKPNFHAFNLF